MFKGKKKSPDIHSDKISRLFIRLGLAFVIFSILIFTLVFAPVITAEIGYAFFSSKNPAVVSRSAIILDYNNIIIPLDETFGIVIPKINANARIIKDVDAFDSSIYQKMLMKGVAHAKGSAYPSDNGNVFIFAHSSDNWYRANRYNSVFYLLHKLEKNDEIYIFYENRKYKYLVTKKSIVEPQNDKYMKADFIGSNLTLMTCWPPGTTLKRLLIFAVKV
jgi:sortase A